MIKGMVSVTSVTCEYSSACCLSCFVLGMSVLVLVLVLVVVDIV